MFSVHVHLSYRWHDFIDGRASKKCKKYDSALRHNEVKKVRRLVFAMAILLGVVITF